MKLLNKSKCITLSEDAKIASSFLSRARGLLFTSPADLVLVSPREDIASSTIHMFLMSYSIDVIWVDSEKKVVDIKKNVPPFKALNPATWRTYRPKKPAKYVIELGAGSARETEEGDVLLFI